MRTILAILNRSLPLTTRFEFTVANHPYPALTIQGVGSGPRGLPAISVFQQRLRHAVPHRHPEMLFEVELHSGSAVDLLPFCWRSEYDELEEPSVFLEGLGPNGKPVLRVDANRLADQCSVAKDWDRLLAAQGLLSAYCHAWHLPMQTQAQA